MFVRIIFCSFSWWQCSHYYCHHFYRIRIISVRYFLYFSLKSPEQITRQLKIRFDSIKIWNIRWKSQTKCSQTRMLQDSIFKSHGLLLFCEHVYVPKSRYVTRSIPCRFTFSYFGSVHLVLHFFFCVTCCFLPISGFFFWFFIRLVWRKKQQYKDKK